MKASSVTFLKSFTASIVMFAAFVVLLVACNAKANQKPPNIILITVDDLGWADLGCYGSNYYQTPHIDGLAENGYQFMQAYAAAAVCSPTRAAIMTGKYPARLGLTDWIRAEFQGGGVVNPVGYDTLAQREYLTPKNPFHLLLSEETIAERLKASGYVSAHIGKWHLGTRDYFPERQGFDVNVAGCDYGQPPSYFDPYIFYPRYAGQDTLFGFPTMEPRIEGEYLTDRETAEAIDFIRENRETSFFLNLNHYAVHTPIQAKPDLVELYTDKTNKQGSPEYAAMVHSVDEALGAILNTLKTLGIDQRTIVIFTSDNGGLKGARFTDNTPLRSGKGYPYEGGIRVPLIIYHPELEGSEKIEVPTVSTDIFYTILSMSGQSSDDSLLNDGKNLVPLMNGGSTLDREDIVWHFPHYRGRDILPYSIIRHKDWKLIKYYDSSKPVELYNLAQDISEHNDLSSELPEIVLRLDGKLAEILSEVGAKMPIVNSQYRNAKS